MKLRTEPVLIRNAVAGVVAILALLGIDAAGIEAPLANALAIGLPLLMAALDARRKVSTEETVASEVRKAFDAGFERGRFPGGR